MQSSGFCGSVLDMKAIERERLRRGWSRQALAMSLGTTGETVYRLERGRQKLTMDWLRRFAHSYGVHVSELLDDAEDETALPSEPGESDARPDNATDWDAVSAAVLPGVAVADTFTMEGDALTPMGILSGDHLIIERGADPAAGDVVICELFGATRIPQTLARVFDPPYLISYSTNEKQRKPILIEDAHVKLIGVVRAVMRLTKASTT